MRRVYRAQLTSETAHTFPQLCTSFTQIQIEYYVAILLPLNKPPILLLTCCIESSKNVTEYFSICAVKVVVTADCSPGIVDADL